MTLCGLLFALLLVCGHAGVNAKGLQPAAAACPDEGAAETVRMDRLYLWPKESKDGVTTRWAMQACMSAPEGQARTVVGLSAMLFRPQGHFWAQDGQTPCHPKTPQSPTCHATRFVIEFEALGFNPGRGDMDPVSHVAPWVFVHLVWTADGERYSQRFTTRPCFLTSPAEAAAKCKERPVLKPFVP